MSGHILGNLLNNAVFEGVSNNDLIAEINDFYVVSPDLPLASDPSNPVSQDHPEFNFLAQPAQDAPPHQPPAVIAPSPTDPDLQTQPPANLVQADRLESLSPLPSVPAQVEGREQTSHPQLLKSLT